MKPEKNIRKPRVTTRKAVIKALSGTTEKNSKVLIRDPQEIQDAIRLKAYELYVERGYVMGNDVEDWLTAESIILNKYK